MGTVQADEAANEQAVRIQRFGKVENQFVEAKNLERSQLRRPNLRKGPPPPRKLLVVSTNSHTLQGAIFLGGKPDLDRLDEQTGLDIPTHKTIPGCQREKLVWNFFARRSYPRIATAEQALQVNALRPRRIDYFKD